MSESNSTKEEVQSALGNVLDKSPEGPTTCKEWDGLEVETTLLGSTPFDEKTRARENSTCISLKQNGTVKVKIPESRSHSESGVVPSLVNDVGMQSQLGVCSWSLFPVCLSVSLIIGALTIYCIARAKCHVLHFWIPYISYTGNYHPEYMMFGMLLNGASFFNAMHVILVWRLLQALQPTEKRYIQNTCSIGLGTCVGVCVVANFQVESAPNVHYMGAFCGFVLNTIYLLLVTQILSSVSTRYPTKICPKLVRLRWIIAICGAATFVICFMITSIAPLVPEFEDHKKKFIENYPNPNCAHSDNDALSLREPGADGKIQKGLLKYSARYNLVWSLGALFEWLNAFFYCVYTGLFYYEFKLFDHVKIILKDNERKRIDNAYFENIARQLKKQNSDVSEQSKIYDNNDGLKMDFS